jgi:hypothetical protein
MPADNADLKDVIGAMHYGGGGNRNFDREKKREGWQ